MAGLKRKPAEEKTEKAKSTEVTEQPAKKPNTKVLKRVAVPTDCDIGFLLDKVQLTNIVKTFKLVKDSGWNGIVTNPVNNVTDTFMLIALQDGFFSPEIDKIWYALKNDDTIKNRIDWNRVYLTGLS